MPRWRSWIADDGGSASLEFVTAGVLLLLPVVYLVLTLSALESGSFAVEGAARQAARVFVQGSSVAEAQSAARLAVRDALADYGIDDAGTGMTISCTPKPADCLARLGHVTVSVTTSVALPLVPAGLTVHVPLRIALQAASTEQVSRFWGAG
jgi:hypothetical protein